MPSKRRSTAKRHVGSSPGAPDRIARTSRSLSYIQRRLNPLRPGPVPRALDRYIQHKTSPYPTRENQDRRVRRVQVDQKIVPRRPFVTRRGLLRFELQPSWCRKRKEYKKTMLRKIAAQQKSAGGRALQKWRKVRRNTNPGIYFRC